MNDRHGYQPQFDFRTGRPTAISGAVVTPEQRSACSALNRQRTRGIQEAARQADGREPLSDDVWYAHLARSSVEWTVPLIDIGALGLSLDRDRFLVSSFLVPLKSGAEACPFFDSDWEVVYKLFPLSLATVGRLGKTLVINHDEENEDQMDLSVRDATLLETIEKLSVLHLSGALPTEIVGLASSGDYLIVKQPFAQPYAELGTDRERAVDSMKAVACRGPVRRPLWVMWVEDQAWFLSDLHEGNVMRDSSQEPVIIDALVSVISPAALKRWPWLGEAAEEAKFWRTHGYRPKRRVFGEDVSDDEL